jgi:NAD(P)H-flavin reductase
MAIKIDMSAQLIDPMLPLTSQVKRCFRETQNTWTLELENSNFGGFLPGQFNMLYVMGVGEIPVSMSGDPDKPGLTHTVRSVGAVSNALTTLKKGDTIGVRGPYGTSWPVAQMQGKDVVIMTGGIGLAPLRPLIYQLFNHRKDYGRINLLYGARNPADILYPKQLQKWQGKKATTVAVTVDIADTGWIGNVGVVTELVNPNHFDPTNTIACVCGPEVMMRYAVKKLRDAGLPLEAIYLSMERNMKCAVGHCGHCQLGPTFICKDGPVFRYDQICSLLGIREL